MYSRRAFLVGLLILVQGGLAGKVHGNTRYKRNRTFVKQGWVLQEGDL
ncbi:MAG: hypothetical protein Nkreftii_001423 [Candidatus Nitrospira kreftii]|uniref:Uncharacterized protein n=1 Tax=Candidatus Nitrospira kreftii TaxID=2652173 RepID=A0A7S8FCN0_9BACT|nr:MAG: hypothetical protein Nkreftii_001423 [Candidatus Nitrospira kreftii]